MAKKDFSNAANPALVPAMQFITPTAEAPAAPVPASDIPAPDPAQAAHGESLTTERKTRRMNLLMQPTLAASLQKLATMQRTSVNDLICTAMQAYVEAHADQLLQYAQVFEGENV